MSANSTFVPYFLTTAIVQPIGPLLYTTSIATRFYRLFAICLFIFVSASSIYFTYNVWFHPLRHVPGPKLAGMSPFWQIYHFMAGNIHEIHMQLHQEYGPIVRTTPNTVIVNDPTYFHDIFNWDKGDWWVPFRGDPVHIAHVSAMEMKDHVRRKNRINGAYQGSHTLKNETKMDKYISTFMQQFRCRQKKVVDFASWTRFLIADISFEMMVSNALNFTAAGSDISGVLKSMKRVSTIVPLMGFLPTLSKIILSGIYMKWIIPRSLGGLHGISHQQITERYENIEKASQEKSDVLQWIIDRGIREPEMAVDRKSLLAECANPILASSDSSVCVIQATVLYLSSTPAVLSRLREEIDAADAKGLLSSPVPRFNEVRQHIPYLDLVIKESMRLFPPTGLALTRAVPVGGATICGCYLPRGTDVGISHWAVGRNKSIFGEDADMFKPERWEFREYVPTHDPNLNNETDAVKSLDTSASRTDDSAQKKDAENKRWLMETSFIPFSSGPMQCTGRFIALTILYKTISQLYRQFEIKTVNPDRPFKIFNRLAVMHHDYLLVLEERKSWKAQAAIQQDS